MNENDNKETVRLTAYDVRQKIESSQRPLPPSPTFGYLLPSSLTGRMLRRIKGEASLDAVFPLVICK
jgi:hypothetical protein